MRAPYCERLVEQRIEQRESSDEGIPSRRESAQEAWCGTRETRIDVTPESTRSGITFELTKSLSTLDGDPQAMYEVVEGLHCEHTTLRHAAGSLRTQPQNSV